MVLGCCCRVAMSTETFCCPGAQLTWGAEEWDATLKNSAVEVFWFYTAREKPSRTMLVRGQEGGSEPTPAPHGRISIAVSGEQLPFRPSILQMGCQELQSGGNSSFQTRTHPLGKKGRVQGTLAELQAKMSSRNPGCWMSWGGKQERRVTNSRVHWESGTGKIVWGNAAAEAFVVFFFPPNPFFSIVSSLDKSSLWKDKGLKLKGLTHISSSQYQISPVILAIPIP